MLRPAERLSRTPDTMQDNGELSGQRHPGFAIPRSLGDRACPILQARGSFDPRQDHNDSLIQQSASERVAAPRYLATAIDFARLILSRREPARLRIATGRSALDRADIRECGQNADARYAHEQPARVVRPHQHTDCFVESSDLLAQLPPGQEHGPDNQRDIGTVEQQSYWPRHSLQPALSTTQMAVIFCETSNPTKRVINEPPILRITGRSLPDRDTIGRSSADPDYRMSI